MRGSMLPGCLPARLLVPTPPPARLPPCNTAAAIRGLEQQQAELEQRAANVRERELSTVALLQICSGWRGQVIQ